MTVSFSYHYDDDNDYDDDYFDDENYHDDKGPENRDGSGGL